MLVHHSEQHICNWHICKQNIDTLPGSNLVWKNHHHLQLINQLCKILNSTDSSTTGVSDELTPWKCMLIFGGVDVFWWMLRDEVGVCGESHEWVPWKDRAERRRRTVSLWNFNRSLVGYLRNLCNNSCSNGSVFSDSGAENHKLECILTFILAGVEGRKDSHKHKKKVRRMWVGGWGDLSIEARLQGLLTWDSGKQESKIISMRDWISSSSTSRQLRMLSCSNDTSTNVRHDDNMISRQSPRP